MSKALDSGKSLAELLAAKLPESLRPTLQEIFAKPEAADALTLLGDSALARSDYSRSKDELDRLVKLADARIAAGTAGPLTGVPVAHKDIFCAEGWLTTCGSKMLSNFTAPYDAHVIEQFNAAGAVNLGKTNMDEFAMGSSNETSFFGPVRNPWNTETVPGGSSGGSAAAVAARRWAGGNSSASGVILIGDQRGFWMRLGAGERGGYRKSGCPRHRRQAGWFSRLEARGVVGTFDVPCAVEHRVRGG